MSILISACSIDKKDSTDNSDLKSKMRTVHTISQNIFLYTWNSLDSLSKTDQSKLKNLIDDLSKNFHSIDKINNNKTKELGFKLILRNQENLLNEISSALEKNQTEYALWKLKGLTHNCFYCHSRLHNQVNLYSPEVITTSSSFDARLAEAEFLVASRQFKIAEEKLLNLAREVSKLESGQPSVIKTIKLWLLLQIRVQANYVDASNNLNQLINEVSLNNENNRLITHWSNDLKKLDSNVLNADQNQNEIKDQLNKAEQILSPIEAETNQDQDDLAFVKSAYATSILHNLTTSNINESQSQKIALLLGLAYSRLTIPSLNTIATSYLTDCIENGKDKNISKLCYKSYERWYNLNHTGSGGLHDNEEEQTKLKNLKVLSN